MRCSTGLSTASRDFADTRTTRSPVCSIFSASLIHRDVGRRAHNHLSLILSREVIHDGGGSHRFSRPRRALNQTRPLQHRAHRRLLTGSNPAGSARTSLPEASPSLSWAPPRARARGGRCTRSPTSRPARRFRRRCMRSKLVLFHTKSTHNSRCAPPARRGLPRAARAQPPRRREFHHRCLCLSTRVFRRPSRRPCDEAATRPR